MRNNKKERKRLKAIKLKNKKLIKKYPWLAFKDYGTNKIDYSYIHWGCTQGWDRAYGDMYLKELGEAVERCGRKHSFHIYEIKEKFGQHRVYCDIPSQEVADIVDKYEKLSENICVGCGKPDVPMINQNHWFLPTCDKCFKLSIRHWESYTNSSNIKTDEEIEELYKNSICSDSTMPDSFTRVFSYDENDKNTKTVDISETANKIRTRWNNLIVKLDKRKTKRSEKQ